MARGLRRRRHRGDRRGDPLLPVHERVGGADGAGGPRRVRGDPLVRLGSSGLQGRDLGGRGAHRMGGDRLRVEGLAVGERARVGLRTHGVARRPGADPWSRPVGDATRPGSRAGRPAGVRLARLAAVRRCPEPMGQRGEPVGQPERADVSGRRERGRRRGRYATERADRELRRPRRTVRHEHRVRVGQDLHERLPHRTARRGDRTLDHLLRHARQLPGGRTDDVHPGERGLRRHVDRALV